jgi:hypothetical protein
MPSDGLSLCLKKKKTLRLVISLCIVTLGQRLPPHTSQNERHLRVCTETTFVCRRHGMLLRECTGVNKLTIVNCFRIFLAGKQNICVYNEMNQDNRVVYGCCCDDVDAIMAYDAAVEVTVFMRRSDIVTLIEFFPLCL